MKKKTRPAANLKKKRKNVEPGRGASTTVKKRAEKDSGDHSRILMVKKRGAGKDYSLGGGPVERRKQNYGSGGHEHSKTKNAVQVGGRREAIKCREKR